MKYSKKKIKKNKHSRKHTKQQTLKHIKKHYNKLSTKLNTQVSASYDTSKYRETEFLKTLNYEPPLLKYKLTNLDIENLRDDNSTANYTKNTKHIKHNSKYDYNTNNNLQFNPDEFHITYKIKKIEPNLAYLIQESYILQKDKINSNSFFKIWSLNNFNLFDDLINTKDPYFNGKYEIAEKYDYFIPYSYDISIYDDIYNNILGNIHKSNKDLDIKIFSPFMDNGVSLHSILRLSKIHNIIFSGCTVNKYAYNGFNELAALYNLQKLPLETANLETTNSETDYINTVYKSSVSNKQMKKGRDIKTNIAKMNLYYGEYEGKDIPENSLDLIISELPHWNQFYIKTQSTYNSKNINQYNYINNFLKQSYMQLKNNGYMVLIIDTLSRGNINIINNIKNIIGNLHIINMIRLTSSETLDEHDNFIIVLQKNVIKQDLDTSKLTRDELIAKNLIIKDVELSSNRTIKIVYDNCANTKKSDFNCPNGYLEELDNKIYDNFYENIKQQGYTELCWIVRYPAVNYIPVVKSILRNNLELTVIFISLYKQHDIAYIFEKMIYDIKYVFNSKVLIMNTDEYEEFIKSLDTKKTYIEINNIDKDEKTFQRGVKIHKEHLEPIFKNVKIVWHNGNLDDTKYLCTAFPNIEFKFIVFYHPEKASETEIILMYKKLNLKNLKIYLPVVPFINFPNIDYNSGNQLPAYVYYYSTYLKYAKDGDLVYCNYYI